MDCIFFFISNILQNPQGILWICDLKKNKSLYSFISNRINRIYNLKDRDREREREIQKRIYKSQRIGFQ